MSLDLGPAIRTAILADATIVALLSTYLGEAAVFTRRPVPTGTTYPLVVISDDVSVTDRDALVSRRPVVIRDVLVYGNKPAQYRVVEQIAYLLRELFHRQKGSLTNADYDIIEVQVFGPRTAPTSDDEIIGRLVSLTISTRRK